MKSGKFVKNILLIKRTDLPTKPFKCFQKLTHKVSQNQLLQLQTKRPEVQGTLVETRERKCNGAGNMEDFSNEIS